MPDGKNRKGEFNRRFLREVLRFPFVSDGHGPDAGTDADWLIFGTGPSELGVHPTSSEHEGTVYESPLHHQIALMTHDLAAAVEELRGRGAVFTREIVQTDVRVSFAGKDYSCVVVRDIFPSAEKVKRKGAGVRKEVHYHCYAAGAGYLGTKTASFEKDGDVEHVPSFAEIPSWFLVRQRSAN